MTSIQSQPCLTLAYTNPQRERTAKRHAGGFPVSFTLAHISASACAIRSLSASSWNCSSLFRISFPISVEWKRKENHIYPRTVSWLSFSLLSSYLLELSKRSFWEVSISKDTSERGKLFPQLIRKELTARWDLDGLSALHHNPHISLLFSHSVMSDSLLPHGLQLPELAQTHVHWVGDAIQPSHPLSSPSPAFNLSHHQDLFQWVSSSHQVPKV